MHLGLISIMDILDPYCKQGGVVTVVGTRTNAQPPALGCGAIEQGRLKTHTEVAR